MQEKLFILFIIGIILTLTVSTNFEDIISIRIAIGSGVAFFIAQNLDVQIFDKLRNKAFIAPLTFIAWINYIFIFFNGILCNRYSLVCLALGDLTVKLLITVLMLIP